jgi:regulator of sirC expression with transglutaminase-like and TPR domain
MTPAEARQRLAALAAGEDHAIDLARAALYLAAEEYPALDIEAYVARLEAMAEDVADLPLTTAPPLGRLLALNQYLFALQGFRGNAAHYYDPRNSFLNEVLDRRTGIPITLSIVYLEVGWRLELPLAGVGTPTHFLVGYYAAQPPYYIDVFHQGLLLRREDCIARLRAQFGADFVFRDEYLAPVSKRQILTRLLTNLKLIYSQQGDWDRALGAVERILLLNPDAPAELRDRGLIQYRRGVLRAARADLARYLQLAPHAADGEAVQGQLALIEELWARRN